MPRQAHTILEGIHSLVTVLWEATEQCRLAVHLHLNCLNLADWDSPPYAVQPHKSEAVGRIQIKPELQVALRQTIHKSTTRRSCSRQKAVYQHLIDNIRVQYDWLPLLDRRFFVLCPGHSLVASDASWFFFVSLDHELIRVKVLALRSLLNAWATSRRYHESV